MSRPPQAPLLSTALQPNILRVLQACLLFAGSAFESSPGHKLAKSMLLDTLRGQVVESLDLKVSRSPVGLSTVFPEPAHSLVSSGLPSPFLLPHISMLVMQGAAARRKTLHA